MYKLYFRSIFSADLQGTCIPTWLHWHLSPGYQASEFTCETLIILSLSLCDLIVNKLLERDDYKIDMVIALSQAIGIHESVYIGAFKFFLLHSHHVLHFVYYNILKTES